MFCRLFVMVWRSVCGRVSPASAPELLHAPLANQDFASAHRTSIDEHSFLGLAAYIAARVCCERGERLRDMARGPCGAKTCVVFCLRADPRRLSRAHGSTPIASPCFVYTRWLAPIVCVD
jgi:hypothetical protein